MIDQLADVIKEGDVCEASIRRLIIRNMSDQHREVYRLLKKHGEMSSADLRARHGNRMSIQQVSTILGRMMKLGVVDRYHTREHGGMYVYRVVSAEVPNARVGGDGSDKTVVGEQQAATS